MKEPLGENIKRFRIKNGLKQKELADLSGLSSSTVCDIEKGRVNPSISSLYQMAKALEVSPEYFFADQEGKNKKIEGLEKQYYWVRKSPCVETIEDMVEILREKLGKTIKERQDLQDSEVQHLSRLLDSLLNFLNR